MSTLLELAERCEAATGPDRELDVAIWRACDPDSYTRWEGDQRAMLSRDFDEPKRLSTLHARAKAIVRQFTASIDAAMTLVPEKHYFGVGDDGAGDGGPPAWAWVSSRDDFEIVRANTPALALCAAALRSRLNTQVSV